VRGWLALVVVLALAGGAVAAWRLDLVDAWFASPPDPATEPAEVPPPEGIEVPELATPAAVAEAADPGTLKAAAVRRALAPGLRDRDLGRSVHAAVAGLDGEGAPAFTAGSGAFVPASTMKLLTGTAALASLGADHRFATTVLARGRTITLVGGGDPLLARRPVDDTWPERADVVTLARRTARALPRSATRRPVRLRYDTSLFTGPAENPSWRPDYVPDGIVSPISALWVDGGRSDTGFGRVEDPAATAAAEFAAALARQGVRVQGAPQPRPAPARAEEVARVESAPLSQVVEQAILVSDNETSEVLAHHVGLAVVGDGSFAGGARGVRRALADLGVPLDGAVLRDGSGLSRDNRLQPRALIEVLRLAADEANPGLRAVASGLPVAAFTGSLTYRFDEAPEAGLGRVRAKTGTLTGVSALAGIAVDRTGNPLAFVLAADRVRLPDTLDAQQDIDNLAGTLGACRCSR
jgi:D-alanyl-D-alanine carboxypeptidase/D-alanyl-D-alanine-endopeptidase (penicillin-binding protein 4)